MLGSGLDGSSLAMVPPVRGNVVRSREVVGDKRWGSITSCCPISTLLEGEHNEPREVNLMPVFETFAPKAK